MTTADVEELKRMSTNANGDDKSRLLRVVKYIADSQNAIRKLKSEVESLKKQLEAKNEQN